MASEGKDYLINISSDGTAEGTKTELELQGDSTINFGKSVSTTKYKNGTTSRQSEAGMSVTGSFALGRPMSAAQTLLWAAHDDGKPRYFWIEDKEVGGLRWAGMFKVAISEKSTPVDGDVLYNFTLGEDGPITRSVVTV